ncbi:MAG: SUMF1/EgtB/PvdO family nonheme iron enzyme, partial [Nitrospirales bacterium]
MKKFHRTIGGTMLTSLLLITAPALSASPENMVLVPRGEFVMGSNDHQDEKPHNVVLDAYYIDTYEVSNKDYKDFMKTTGHPAPAYW